ncbi:hypothetical protein IW140_000440 [Coemansia sp. RSA 1813]|nr:hypothetical protein EV178_000601 [Coemansia sp. RSA 1646]KAJ1773310.1 hypothetical protein LPJ74_000821 [Coemansia sp. RSA 1843]KAJ2092778.1 hypothetical protein IW138_000873 [Coemansia sp. RSA 986]KAJ2217722.1 hypothetical protein EV179_000207 [Coemansia sp. RSA 487]KAJ2573041.1 hypothetical protein IW140_000440 [Coemansia sp. RSA 1813]
MPIRNIDVYVRELRLTQETRISALADTRLGIEGHNWLRQMMSRAHDGESVAMGGLPQVLEAEIVKELGFFRSHNITPVVVFSGLPVARKDGRPFAKDDHRPSQRNAAWDMYWQKHTEQALRKWGTASPYAQGDMVPFVMQVLQAHGVEFMRAPYASWAQLAYLYKHESQPIHAIYSSLDVLMFDVDRVITTISPIKQTFGWIQRDHIVSKCGVASEQILDMCILAGFDWCPTFPALLSDIGFSFKSAVDITRQYRSGFSAIQMMGDHAGTRSSNYCDSFMRAYCIVKYHIVMHLDGSVGPLNPEYAPNDIHDIIGYRLPTAAYHLMARGAIQPPVLNMLVSGSWLEFSPADNGESSEYQRLVTQWESSIYKQLCAPLCVGLGPFFQQRKVTMCAWFDPHNDIVLHDAGSSGKPQTHGEPLAAKATGSPRTAVSLAQVLQRSGKLLAASGDPSGSDEELALAVLVSLGFVTRSGKHTQLGAALLKGLLALGQSGNAAEQQWPVVVATILFAQGLLTGEKWTVAYEDERPAAGDERQQRFVRLVSRIATLVPLCGRKGQWRLAYNRDLLAFSSAAKVVLKAAASILDSARLERAVASSDGQAVSGKLQIPLECATNSGGGLLVHALLTDYVRSGSGCWQRVRDEAGDSIGDAGKALCGTWQLVEAVLAMAQEYRKSSVGGKAKVQQAQAAADTAESAHEWAQQAFDEALG